jgi:hypothetical protein
MAMDPAVREELVRLAALVEKLADAVYGSPIEGTTSERLALSVSEDAYQLRRRLETGPHDG